MADPQLPTLAKPTTLAEWRLRIVQSLGGYEWNVELTEKNLDHAMWLALMLFAKYRPFWRRIALGNIDGEMSFDLSYLDEGTQVREVQWQHGPPYHTHSPFFAPQFATYYGVQDPRFVHQARQAYDRYSSMSGAQPTYKWVEDERKLYISAYSSFSVLKATALVLLPMTIDNVPYHLNYDFHKCALAETKKILGRKLKKYGSIPSAQGDITLDGDDLKSEGDQELKEIEARLAKNARIRPPAVLHS